MPEITFSTGEYIAYDGGIKITLPQKPTIIRENRKVFYLVGPDGIIRRATYNELIQKGNIIGVEGSVNTFQLSGILLTMRAEGLKMLERDVTVLQGFRKRKDGTVEPYNNTNLTRALFCKLKPGDHISDLHDYAKNLYIGKKAEETRAKDRSAGFSDEFLANVKKSASADEIENPLPLFLLTFYGTSRVDIEFCRKHKREFLKKTFLMMQNKPLYKTLGLPGTAYALERFTLANDHSIQIVVGLKPELVKAFAEIEMPRTIAGRRDVIRKKVRETIRGKERRPADDTD